MQEIIFLNNKIFRNSLWFGILFIGGLSLILIFSGNLVVEHIGLALLVVILLMAFILFPEYGIYTMVFLAPATEWHMQIFGLKIAIVEIVALLSMSAFLIRYFFADKLQTKIIFPLFWPFILFFLGALFSSYFSAHPLDSLRYTLRWIGFFYFFYVVLPFNILHDRKSLQKAFGVFALAGVVIAIIGALSLFGQNWMQELVRVKPISILGFLPLGKTQNMLVEPLLPAIFYLLILRTWSKDGLLKKFLTITFIFALVILLGTFSRAAWLSLSFCLLLYSAVIYRDSLKKFILFGILLFVLLTPLAWQMYRLQTDYAVGIGSNNSRFLMTQIAYRTFIKYPVLGEGPGEYINIIDDNIRFRAKFGSPLEAHGVYLKVAAENGIIGIIGFSLLILVFLKQSQEFLKKYMEPANILIFLAALSIILVEVFEVSYYKAKLWLPIVLALSAYEIISNERKKNNSGESHFSD